MKKIGQNRNKNQRKLVELLEKEKSFFSRDVNTLRKIFILGFASILLTFLCFLKVEKMLSNPFVNLIDINIGHRVKLDTLRSIKCQIDSMPLVNSSSMFSRESIRILNMENDSTNLFELFFGRTIGYRDHQRTEIDQTLLETVLAKENALKIKTRSINESMLDGGLVVTEQLLNQSKYELSASHISLWNEKGRSLALPVPIIAVVKDLPGRTDLMFTESTWKTFFSRDIDDVILDKYPLKYFVPNSKLKRFENEFEAYRESIKKPDIKLVPIEDPNLSYIDGSYFTVKFQNDPYISDDHAIENFHDNFFDLLGFKTSSSIFRTLYLSDLESPEETQSSSDYLTVHFEPLNYVELIAGVNYLGLKNKLRNTEIDVDYSKIEQKKIIPEILLVFVVLGLFTYLTTVYFVFKFVLNQVKQYLNSVKKSYGQLKALGLSEELLLEINSRVSRSFLKETLLDSKNGWVRSIAFLIPFSFLLIVSAFSTFNIISVDITLVLFFVFGNLLSILFFRSLLYRSIQGEVNAFVKEDPGDMIYLEADRWSRKKKDSRYMNLFLAKVQNLFKT